MKKIFLTFYLLLSNFLYAQTFFPAKDAYLKVQNKNAIFIDVRTQPEVENGIIKGALWIPLSEIQQGPRKVVEKIKKQHNGKKVFVYCRSGSRSEVAKELLKDQGLEIENVGGFEMLKEAGIPINK